MGLKLSSRMVRNAAVHWARPSSVDVRFISLMLMAATGYEGCLMITATGWRLLLPTVISGASEASRVSAASYSYMRT